jgi:exonuclease III
VHNSTSNKRGVGILIASSLQYTVINTFRDNNNNLLAIRISISDSEILLVSIYGPNTNDSEFFSDLRNILKRNRDIPAICGGDWNTTFSTLEAENNIDIFSMSSPPSVIRSRWLLEICDEYHLMDPYRAINPFKRDFTFIPRTGARNRSRLDFF